MDDANLKILACNMRRALRAPEECDIPYLLEKGAAEIDRLLLENAGLRLERRMALDRCRYLDEWVADLTRERIGIAGLTPPTSSSACGP